MSTNTLARKPAWQQLLVFLFLIGLFFIIERQIQVYLGKQAIAASALPASSFEAAQRQSQQSGKPVLANFSAIWCSACRRLERKVLADPRVQETILADFHYTRLEYENGTQPSDLQRQHSDREWFDIYRVSEFPTLLVIDGERVRRLPLSYDIDAFLAQLQ